MQLGRKRSSGSVHSPNRVKGKKNALTAGGQRVKKGDGDTLRRLIQPWQARSFSYYDMLGEIKYASQFYSRMLSPLRLYAAEIDKSGDLVETTNKDAIEMLDRIQDPGGGREGLLGSYGRLMFLVGEAQLFCSLDPDTEEEQWEMLSTDELRFQSGSYIRYKAPSLQAEEYHEPNDDDFEPVDDETAVAYRLWKRHPRYSLWADSTMEGVLDLCEELVLLTQAVRSRARSRLAGSGILWIDESISPPPAEPEPDEDPDADPLLEDLTEGMTTAIVDEGAASAVVPLLVRVPVPDGMKLSDLVYHMQIVDPTQLYPETGLRYECIKRMALGLDMPPEVLLGMEQANHWTAWQVDEQTWKGHGQPLANQLINDLNSSYYRPQLRELGVADWKKYSIAYDATAIINHPDRTADAKDLYEKRAIGKKALRVAAGFDEEDAPDEKERAEMVGIATRDSSLAWDGIPSVKAGGLEPRPGEIVNATDTNAAGAQPPGQGASSEVDKGAPSAPDQALPEAVLGSNGHSVSLARVLGAADLAVLRAREAAGNRIRSYAKRDPEVLELIDGVKARDVAATLGADRVRLLHVDLGDVIASTGMLVGDALRMWGINDAEVCSMIVAQVERHVIRTLYDANPPPLPPTFSDYVAGLAAGIR